MSAYDDYKYYRLTQADKHLLKTHSIRTQWLLTYVLISGDKTFRELLIDSNSAVLPIICFAEIKTGPWVNTFINSGKSRRYSELDLYRFKRDVFNWDMTYIVVEDEDVNTSDRISLYNKIL